MKKLVMVLFCFSSLNANAQTNLADLDKPNQLQLNYQNSSTNPNWIDKVQQGRVIEGNQELASFELCKKARKEFENNQLKAEEVSVSDSCMALMLVNNLVKTTEDTRRGDNKRRSTVQAIGTVFAGIKTLTGF